MGFEGFVPSPPNGRLECGTRFTGPANELPHPGSGQWERYGKEGLEIVGSMDPVPLMFTDCPMLCSKQPFTAC